MIKIFGFYISSKFVIAGLLTLFGAIAHATARWKIARANKEKDFTIVDYLILIPICVFSGTVFGMIFTIYFEETIYLYIACSIGGFLGIEGLNKIIAVFLAKVKQ